MLGFPKKWGHADISDTLNHLDLFFYIGGFSGAGGMLGGRKLDPKTDFNGAFADPAVFAKKVHLLWLA
jgi:enterochelin esterase family protein